MPPESRQDQVKRLPACDACKLRRVKCDPVPPPESCSRCLSKGVVCRTTPGTRKTTRNRSGKRIEAAKAAYGSLKLLHEASPIPIIKAENFLVQFELSGELAAHLLELFSKLPRSSLIPGASLSQKFEATGRRIALLPQRTQVLALCVLAISARLSPHPLLFGPGPKPPQLASLFEPDPADQLLVAEWGRKRQNACQRLRELAVERAWNARLLTGQVEDENGNIDNEVLAACQLLYGIEARYDLAAGYPWRAAFISILRKKLEMQRHAASRNTSGSNESIPGGSELGWTTHIMRETLASAALEQISPYTTYDEELVCGPRPVSPEKILEHADTFGIADSYPPRSSYEGEATRAEWWDLACMLCLVRPFSYRMSEIAIASYDFSLRRAHKEPFDISKLEAHLSSLVPLQNLVEVANERMKALLSPPAVVIRRQMGRGSASSIVTGEKPGEINELYKGESDPNGDTLGPTNVEGIHSPADEFRTQLTARWILALIHGAMGAILIPVYVDIEERLHAFDGGYECAGDDVGTLRALREALRKALLPHAQAILKVIRSVVHVAWAANLTRSIRTSAVPRPSVPTANGSSPSSTSGHWSTQHAASSSLTPLTGSSPASSDSSRTSSHGGLPSTGPSSKESSRATPLMPPVNPLGWEARMLQQLNVIIFPRVASREHGNDSLAFWAKVILDSPAIEDGGSGITRAQKAAELECVLNVSRILSWSYPSLPESLVGLIERDIATLKASSSSSSPSAASDSLAAPSTSSRSTSASAQTDAAAAISSIPTLKEVVDGIRHERVSDVFFGGESRGGQGAGNVEDVPDVIGELCRDLNRLSFAADTPPNNLWAEYSSEFHMNGDASSASSDGLSGLHVNASQAPPNFDSMVTGLYAGLPHDQTTFSIGADPGSVVKTRQKPNLSDSTWMSWNFGGGDIHTQSKHQGQLQAPDTFSTGDFSVQSSTSSMFPHGSILSPPQVHPSQGAIPASAVSFGSNPPSAAEIEHEFQRMFGASFSASQTNLSSFRDLFASTGNEATWRQAGNSDWRGDMSYHSEEM